MTYDERGRQLLHISFEGVVTENVYDAYGRLSQMRYYQSEADFDAAAVSETREFFYDEYGRNVGNRLLNASGNPTRVEATVFDDRGRVLFEESPEGNLRYGYDWLGRMSYTAVFDSGLSFQLADVTSAERITHYDYDLLGRLVSVQEDATPADDSDNPQTDTTYGFDLLGRQRAQRTIAPGDPAMNGILTEYVFDDLGRLDLMTNTYSSGNVTASYDYKVRADGKRTALEETFWIDANEDGVQDAGELKTTTYDWEYDAAGRLVDEAIDHWDDNFDLAERFTYDLTGNRIGLDRDQGNDSTLDEAITYQFDANDRLVEEILDDLTATNVDTTTTYDYDHTQQIEKVVTETGSGWAISRQQFAYNLQGRIASAISEGYDSGTLVSRERTSYSYNSQSYRVTLSTETGTSLSTDVTAESWQLKRETSFLADVHNHTGYVQTIRETTVENGNTLVTDYTFGHDEIAQTKHGVDAQGNAVDETRVFGHDGHGSVRVLYDLAETATSIIEQVASYAAYGSVIAIHSGAGTVVGTDEASFASNLGYSGEQWDGSLQLQNLRARSYDPLTGRFIGLDPFSGNMQDPQSLHKYAYVHGDPIQGVDPTGKFNVVSMLSSLSIGSRNRAQNQKTQTGILRRALGKKRWQVHLAVGSSAPKLSPYIPSYGAVESRIGHSAVAATHLRNKKGLRFDVGADAFKILKIFTPFAFVPGSIGVSPTSLSQLKNDSTFIVPFGRLSNRQYVLWQATILTFPASDMIIKYSIPGVIGSCNCYSFSLRAALIARLYSILPL